VVAGISRLWRRRQPAEPGSDGRLIYAVGDVHGRADLLAPLIDIIAEDAHAAAPSQPPVLIFLGDYVDRGADSRLVIDLIIALDGSDRFELRALKGNHEEAVLAFLQDAAFGQTWADFGGLQTLQSYGVVPPSLRTHMEDWERARVAFGQALPRAHLGFLANLELMATYGDYAFVHAGVRPGLALDAQNEHDLLWIRDEFLQARGPFGAVIVHGHTPKPEPFLGPHRIGVDTGAYATGVLTAVRILDADRSILQARTKAAARAS
jgi:serine/threonine protein phosphatase 1